MPSHGRRLRLHRSSPAICVRLLALPLALLMTGLPAMTASGAGTPDAVLISKADPSMSSDSAGGPSRMGSVSADGRYVVFTSEASNVVAGQVDVNQGSDVFIHDRVAGTTTLVSHLPGLRRRPAITDRRTRSSVRTERSSRS